MPYQYQCYPGQILPQGPQMHPQGMYPPQPGLYYAPPAPNAGGYHQAYQPGSTVIVDERQRRKNDKDKTESLCAW